MYLSSLIQQLFLTINYIFPQRNNNLINKIGFNNLQNVFIKKPYSIINTILFRLYKEYRLSQCLQSLYVLNRINVLKIKNNFHLKKTSKYFTLIFCFHLFSVLSGCGPHPDKLQDQESTSSNSQNSSSETLPLPIASQLSEQSIISAQNSSTNKIAPTAKYRPEVVSPTSTNSNNVVIAAATPFETCPNSNTNSAATVVSNLSIQSHQNFNNNSGLVKATASGARRGLEANRVETVNCVSWVDGQDKARSVNLGSYLYSYVMKGQNSNTRYEATDDAVGHPGFGYLVSHNSQNGNSPLSSAMPPSAITTTVFAGANHSIHQIKMNYVRDYEGGGYGIQIPTIIEWLVVAGQNNPIWSVNWQMDKVINPNNINFDNYKMDTRGPYGSIGWDGKKASQGNSELVKMVEWGAGGKKFVATQNDGIRSSTPWTYNEAIPLNYNKARPVTSPLEFGIVQTQTDLFMGYQDGVGGLLNKTSQQGMACPSENKVMPCSWAWPYQMMQFSGPYGEFSANPTTGKIMAWGSPYGYLGSSSFYNFLYSGTQSGKNQRKYATSIVWDEYNNSNNDPVQKTIVNTHAISNFLKLTELIDFQPSGKYHCQAILPGCTIESVISSNGSLTTWYNPQYLAHEIQLRNSAVQFKLANSSALNSNLTAKNPLFVFYNYDGRPTVLKANNVELVAGVDYLASYDTAQKRLFVTLLKTIQSQEIIILGLNY